MMDPPPLPAKSSASTSSSSSQKQGITADFPTLECFDPSTPHNFFRPTKCINEGADVARFLTSKAYRDICLFLLQLNRALCPRIAAAQGEAQKPDSANRNTRMFPINANLQYPQPVQNLQKLLARLDAIIDEVPPDPGPRRFGNISFRKWHSVVAERADALLEEFISENVLGFAQAAEKQESGGKTVQDSLEEAGEEQTSVPTRPLDELRSYFIGAFGSEQRLDYGTGHELSFLAFLGCLWKLGAFRESSEGHTPAPGDMERFIVLGVIEP
jgi:serine/threonine-protein phosphatase 2A activator